LSRVDDSQKADENGFIGGFEFNNGEFLLDSGRRGTDKTAFVKNIRGQEGQVRLRRFQALENPCCLPDELPILPPLEVTKDSSEQEVKDAANARSFTAEQLKGSKKKISKT
jgi:hypothetical protein